MKLDASDEFDWCYFFLVEDAVEGIRDQMLAVLEQMLLGDHLAAEYMLCHLVSSVYAHNGLLILHRA